MRRPHMMHNAQPYSGSDSEVSKRTFEQLRDMVPEPYENLKEWVASDPQDATEAIRASHLNAGGSPEMAEVFGRMLRRYCTPVVTEDVPES